MLKKTRTEPTELDKTIKKVHDEINKFSADSDEFAKMSAQLDRLYKMKTYKKESSVKPDTLINAGVNLAGIVLILGFEKAHVLSSKALGFVRKSH